MLPIQIVLARLGDKIDVKQKLTRRAKSKSHFTCQLLFAVLTGTAAKSQQRKLTFISLLKLYNII